MASRLFGTDGIRDIAGAGPLSAESVLALGRTIASSFRVRGRDARVVVGRDTRLSGDMIEAALCAGLSASGLQVLRAGVLPTPGVAFLTRALEADAGIVISASHNPFHDNGIKLFGPDGFKLSDDIEAQLEARLAASAGAAEPVTGAGIGRITDVRDASRRYRESLARTLGQDIRLEGTTIVVDAGNGAGVGIAVELFEAAGARVVSLGDTPDGLNINDGVGALHVQGLQRAVVTEGAALGVALDGDADRAILVDEKGAVRNGDDCLAMFSSMLLAEGRLPGRTVVATQMSNLGLEKYLAEEGIQLIRTQVGDRYVVEAMRRGGYVLGGEQSGHVVFLDHSTTGDGLLTALQACRAMYLKGVGLSALAASLQTCPQVLVNVRLREIRPLETLPGVQRAVSRVRETLGSDGRILLRLSGTEPLARVMVEGRETEVIERLARVVADEIAREIGEQGCDYS